ncbi:polymer-forming cytoskeletal protein [Halobacteriovorax sp.]|uniref:bactofilin family protein n=1 Tax=Halobacteriovorax sp. TaxID=2020862 RepID=UPI003569D802
MDNIISIEEQEFTLIGKNTRLNGIFNFSGLTHIAGSLEGDVHIKDQSLLTIEETSRIEGKINCADLKVFGTIKGEIISTGKVEIFPSGSLSGVIKSQHLVIHPGAIMNIDGHTTGS